MSCLPITPAVPGKNGGGGLYCGRPLVFPRKGLYIILGIKYSGKGFHHLAAAEGFDEEIPGAGPDCFYYYVVLADGTDHDHPGIGVQGLDDLQGLQAVHTGHVISMVTMSGLFLKEGHGFPAVLCLAGTA